MKKTMLALLLVVSLCSTSMFAESDNGSLIPDGFTFEVPNLYGSVESGIMLPMVFLEKGWKGMTGVGFPFKAEVGYNWDGYLLGTRFGVGHYGDSSNKNTLIKTFSNTYLGINLSKVLSSRMLSFLPEFLSITPSVGFGIDLLSTEYYMTEAAKNANRVTKASGRSLYLELGLTANYYLNGSIGEYIVPYAGYNINMIFDKGGLVGAGQVVLGVRVYPFARTSKVEEVIKSIPGAEVIKMENGTLIRLTSFAFPANSAEIPEDEQEKLEALIPVLKTFVGKKMLIIGHSALIGTGGERDVPLSEERAQSIAAYYVEHNVKSARLIKAEGRGANEPIASNDTPEGRSLNRRVEIFIYK